MKRIRNVAALVLLVGLAACGGNNSTAPSNTGGGTSCAGNPRQGSVSATVDGVRWVADCYVTVFNLLPSASPAGVGVLSFQAGSAPPALRILNLGVGTTGSGVGTYAGTGLVWTEGAQAMGWQSTGGAVTITAFTSSRAVGTFSFTATATANGATGTRVITNGVFDVTF